MMFNTRSGKLFGSWFGANLVCMTFFSIYGIFFSNYGLSPFSEKPIVDIGGLALYQFCILMWFSALYERVDTKMVYISSIIGFALWHFAVWGNLSVLTTELMGGINGDPSFRVFDKQSVIMYWYLFSWGYVCRKAFKTKYHDLQFMSLSGGVLLAILTGYHLLGYWAVFKQGQLHTEQQDAVAIAEMIKLPDEEFKSLCDSMYGVDCFRFNTVTEGYPNELLNYYAASRNDIVELANNPITKTDEFTFTNLHRDTLFEDNYGPYYSKSFYFNQKDGVVNYVITDYFGDIPVNYLAVTCWMMVLAGILWNWIVSGVGIIHSAAMQRRVRKHVSKKALLGSFVMGMFVSPFLGWVGMDYFFQEFIILFFSLLIGAGLALLWNKNWKPFLFLVFASTIMAPAIYFFVIAMKETSNIVNLQLIEQYCLNALISSTLTLVVMIGGYCALFRRKLFFRKEANLLILAIAVLAIITTYIGTHGIFLDYVMDSEMIRLNHLMASNTPFVEFCNGHDFEICQTVSNPEWKLDFYGSLMRSVWYMLVAGVMSMSGALFALSTFAHRNKR
ncbi:hypothetical protein OTK49_01585 [Vibrio coralliirubri]|uniref:hypothetical protein n=1 Tax=Vibrio coralliirubri TaxID=1516159 RepID=UPI00228364FD|nr:hypothetical protein [Vibrio coralliirubri]MCY9861217.1 hypothetical protein [Vibrio coralliirubri]